MSGFLTRHYIDRAADFYAGSKLTQLDEHYKNSAALLAIHSAISYSDALRVGLGDLSLRADDHKEAVTSLKRLLASKRLDNPAGYKNFEDLLSMKNRISYGSQTIDAKTSSLIATKAERFANWVSRTARQLKLEDWSNDD